MVYPAEALKEFLMARKQTIKTTTGTTEQNQPTLHIVSGEGSTVDHGNAQGVVMVKETDIEGGAIYRYKNAGEQ